MLKKRPLFWVGILLLVLIPVLWVLERVEEKHSSAEAQPVALSVSADSLFRQYQSDEKAADTKYLGKIIEVRGRIAEVDHNGSSELWILSSQPGGGGINCELFPGEATGFHPKKGDSVTVKGKCTGFLMDVNLADCVLSNK